MLNLTNIQGNILRGYASFPHAQFLFFAIHSADDAKAFIGRLLGTDAVTPALWRAKPDATLNIAFTFDGLRALGLPQESLATFPSEFQEGMKRRANELGDIDESSPEHWDDPWRTHRVHMLITIYGRTDDALVAHCQQLRDLLPNGVQELKPDQPAGLLHIKGEQTRKEHFGFEDGLSNPAVEGVPDRDSKDRENVGNPDDKGRFRKIPLGEFLLGHPGEGGEMAPMPLPHLLAHDGSYLVFRKLEQDVVRFRQYLEQQADAFARAIPGGLPPHVTAQDFLAAKMMGRWQDGSSLINYPDRPGKDKRNTFGYAGDPAGARCPLGAHVRRANPRDALGFGGKTMSRHRLIRRGIAYGKYLPPGKEEEAEGQEKRGIIFIALNSGFDQFEFVQQKWMNFGDDFEQGNDTDPIAGNRPMIGGRRSAQMMIPGDEASGRRPFICFDIPRFVTTKGGDYFFVPSLAALGLLASGRVDVA
ncbi:Dyp-type peroxidase [Bradyrhizobium sp. USDA 10063]